MEINSPNVGRAFFIRWALYTTLAWFIGEIVAIILSFTVVNFFYAKETNLIVGLCVGATVGAAQVFAAKNWIELSRSWIYGSIVIIGPPFVAMVLLDESGTDPASVGMKITVGVIVGVSAMLGSYLQSRVLMAHTSKAIWWILASVFCWFLVGLGISISGPALGGIILGVTTGGFMMWIVRAPSGAH